MKIGIIYGGRGAEEFSNFQALTEIKRVLDNYNIETSEIYLNNPDINPKDLSKHDLFFVIDSNCNDYSIRNEIFKCILENNIPLIGQNQKAFSLARNKYQSNQIFANHQLKTPKSVILNVKNGEAEHLKTEILKYRDLLNLKYPLIIKDNLGSSSENVFFCQNISESVNAVSEMYAKNLPILIEEYIDGLELTVPFVQLFGKDIVLSPIQIEYVGPIYNYKLKNKTFRAKTIIPPHLNSKILKTIKTDTYKANKLIGCSYYSRLDIRIHNSIPYIIEINGEPTLCVNDFLTKSARPLGLSYAKIIIGLLGNSKIFKEYARRENKKLFQFIKRSRRVVDSIYENTGD